MDIVGRLIRERVEAKAHGAASKQMADEYATRAKRMAEKEKAIAKALGQLLDASGQRKVAHPLGTVSRTTGRLSVRIMDEADDVHGIGFPIQAVPERFRVEVVPEHFDQNRRDLLDEGDIREGVHWFSAS